MVKKITQKEHVFFSMTETAGKIRGRGNKSIGSVDEPPSCCEADDTILFGETSKVSKEKL